MKVVNYFSGIIYCTILKKNFEIWSHQNKVILILDLRQINNFLFSDLSDIIAVQDMNPQERMTKDVQEVKIFS